MANLDQSADDVVVIFNDVRGSGADSVVCDWAGAVGGNRYRFRVRAGMYSQQTFAIGYVYGNAQWNALFDFSPTFFGFPVGAIFFTESERPRIESLFELAIAKALPMLRQIVEPGYQPIGD